jgi:hypothetical protein
MFVSMLLGSCAWRSAKAKREAVLVLAEDIALDDPFAEMTAPAEAGNIVKEDELSPDPTDFQDVFVCTILFFLATASGP